jgi:hypothetical protein
VADTAYRILLFALVAAASPVTLLATLAVLTSRRGRTNGAAYLVVFLAGQAIAFAVALLLGAAAKPDRDGNEELAAALELAFGLLLLVIALPQRRRGEAAASAGRMKSMLGRVRGLRPGTAFSVGVLLGVGGVKRLSITVLAGATVGLAGLVPVEEAALGVLYVVVAAVLAWVPVSVYLIAGDPADGWMRAAEEWITANERRITFFSTVFFGFLLTSDALVRLV